MMSIPLRPTEGRVLAELRDLLALERRDALAYRRDPVLVVAEEKLRKCAVSEQDFKDAIEGLWGKGLAVQVRPGWWGVP